jgi:hypothetical protein
MRRAVKRFREENAEHRGERMRNVSATIVAKCLVSVAVIVWLLGVAGWLLCRLWLCVLRRDAIEERRR